MLGKVGRELTVEQGYEAARLCALNSLANLKETIGDLDRVVHFVKVLGMINVDPEFGETPAVFRAHRYAPNHAGFQGKELDPARYAELNRQYAQG